MTEKHLGHRTWAPTPLYFPGYFNTVSFGLQGENLKILEPICSEASYQRWKRAAFALKEERNVKS